MTVDDVSGLTRQIALVREAFESAWREEPEPDLLVFLMGWKGDSRQHLLECLLTIDISHRRQLGKQPARSDYEQRLPDSTTILDRVFDETLPAEMPKRVNSTSDECSIDATALLPIGGRRPNVITSTQFGDYELIEEIARGGMGVVFKARQAKANRIVALKMILSGSLADEHQVKRFYAEAEAAASLDHPNIVPVFDVGRHNGQHYFSMGYVEGSSLKQRTDNGPLPPYEAARIARTIAEAVDYAHRKGIIHRDLKPSNVLLDQDGNPRVTDFGLAKQVESNSELTSTGQIMGTPSYMPPEQAGGRNSELGPAADIYSLGAMLYALLTGRPPFQAANIMETLRQVAEVEPVEPRILNPAIAKDLETICLKCLEKNPAQRYRSARELADELGCYLNGQPIQARPIGQIERTWRWCKRQPAIASLIASVIASLILGMTVSTYFALLAENRLSAAVEGRAKAEEGTKIALTTLESVINTIQSKLRDVPQASEIRRELLLNSLADLQRLSGEFASQSRLDHDTAQALIDLAQIFEEFGDEAGLNAVASAKAAYLQAVNIFQQIQASDRGDQQLKVDYARALNLLALHHVDYGARSEAVAPSKEAIEIHRALLLSDPQEVRFKYLLALSLQAHGDTMAALRDFQGATTVFKESLSLLEETLQADPNEPRYLEAKGDTSEKMGDALHDLRQNDNAMAYFQESLAIRRKLHDSKPDFLPWLDNLSFSYERLGNHWMQVRNFDKAQEAYQQMLEITLKVVAIDPQNRRSLDGLSVCYEKMSLVHAALGNQEAAAEARRQIARIRQQLAGAK